MQGPVAAGTGPAVNYLLISAATSREGRSADSGLSPTTKRPSSSVCVRQCPCYRMVNDAQKQIS